METNSAQLFRSRHALALELAQNRRQSLFASEKGEFRLVARLTREAARLNCALAANLPPEESR